MKELHDAASVNPPDRSTLLRWAESYTKATGKPFVPPPMHSQDQPTVKLNYELKVHFEAHDYDVMRAKFLVSMREKVVPDCDTFKYLLEGALSSKSFEMIGTVEEMIKVISLPISLSLWNTFLKSCAITIDHAKADTYWKQMSDTGTAPDIRSLDYYMQAHITPEHFKTVVEVFSKWPAKYSLEVDAEMRGSFIKALLKLGREDVALKRWEAILAGKLPAPTNSTFQYLMEYFLSKNDFSKVSEIFDTIHDKFGLYPDNDNYTLIVEMKMKQKDFEGARKLVWKLCSEGWPINPSVMTQLMSFYQSINKLDTVELIWALLPKGKVKPDLSMLTILITSCLQNRKIDRAVAYIALSKERYNLLPSRTIYAALITAYGRAENLEKVLSLYRRMIFIDQILPGPTTFTALISAYAYNGKIDQILNMLKNPKNHGIPLVNRHLFEDAIEAMEQQRPNPLASLANFDWTRLQDITTETTEDLKLLTESLQAKRM